MTDFERPRFGLQWKGTDICADLNCSCGHHSHFHGMFAYTIQCPACKVVYRCDSSITLTVETDLDRNPLQAEAEEIP